MPNLVLWELVLTPIPTQSFFFLQIKPNVLSDLFSSQCDSILTALLCNGKHDPRIFLETMYIVSLCTSLPLVWTAILNLSFYPSNIWIKIYVRSWNTLFIIFLTFYFEIIVDSLEVGKSSTKRSSVPYILTNIFIINKILVTNPLTFLTHIMPHYFPPQKPEVENNITENGKVENSGAPPLHKSNRYWWLHNTVNAAMPLNCALKTCLNSKLYLYMFYQNEKKILIHERKRSN